MTPTVPGTRFQYKGLFPAIDEASRVSFVYRARLDHIVDEVPCNTCHGARLRSDAAATRFNGLTLRDTCAQPLGETLRRFQSIQLTKHDQQVIGEVLREIINRVKFLVDVGLDYLSLDRKGPTLSGGEAQRIRLASQIGSGLTGVLYVLDEPTIGLHPRDNQRLLAALHHLRDLGNTLLLVEHDREVIESADHLLDFGPGAGDQGGEITAAGSPTKVLRAKQSLTGQYLGGKLAIPVPTNRRVTVNSGSHIGGKKNPADHSAGSPVELQKRYTFPTLHFVSILGARQHNLRNVDVHLPLGCFVAVTGVSGSGKSSLINEVLYNTLARRLNRARTAGAAHDDILGLEHLDKIINVDQDPIGNSPSSNPATYTGVFDLIRELFSRLPESKVRGYHPRRFSFNQKGGRCEACEGNGQKKIEMHFLPDVWVECDTCHGKRYNPETLLVQYHGKTIADVLDMRVSEALELFGNIPKIRTVLQTLADVGLGYMQLGQPAPTMSGGEAQRVKLAAELARPSTGKTLYLLDEPTTGLHFDDVRKLLDVLHRLVDLGNTVIVVEHNLDVIKTADWVIDLGPEAGVNGGRVVAVGTPEDVVRVAESHTGRVLADTLNAGPFAERPKYDARQALAEKLGDIDLADVGQDAKLPWEANGVQWHTRDRITTKGTACKWDGDALLSVIEQVEAFGEWGETNWNHRTIVEVAPVKKSKGWFLHAMTGHEAYLKLAFRTRRNAFKTADLAAALKLRPLSDYAGHEGYSRDHRVEVVNDGRGPGQTVVVTIVNKEETETPQFRAFLKKTVNSFAELTEPSNGKTVEAAMPWKIDGEKWHLSEKGFPPGKGAKWDRALLPKFLQLLREVEPKLKIQWDVVDAITVRVPGPNRFWARIKTKEAAALEVWLPTRPAQFNLPQWEGIGRDPTLDRDRWYGVDVVTLQFITADHLNPKVLKPLLVQQLKGFREMYGKLDEALNQAG
jgi:excinuclease ABC subunit A